MILMLSTNLEIKMFSIMRLNGKETFTQFLEWIEDGIDINGVGCSKYITAEGEAIWLNDVEDFEVAVA